MTSRQRVLASLARQPIDRVPRLLYEEVIGYTPPIERLLQTHCAPRPPREYFDMDLTRVTFAPTRLLRERFRPWLGQAADEALASGRVDEWGVWRRPGDFHHFVRIESPLRGSFDDVRFGEYPWPDLDQAERFAAVPDQVAAWQRAGLAVTAYAGSVFERAWSIRGFEDLMADLLHAPARAHALLERTAHFQQFAARQFARAGADIIVTGDDVAGQTGLLMQPRTWREFLKPHLAATVRVVKETNPDARVFYHCDGDVTALIPELIDIGIDILNPIQPECMNPAEVKRAFGDRLAFFGSVSVQRTMPLGTPADVRTEVKDRIRVLGAGGGFILSPAHVLGPEVPWDNIVAFFDAADTPPPGA